MVEPQEIQADCRVINSLKPDDALLLIKPQHTYLQHRGREGGTGNKHS